MSAMIFCEAKTGKNTVHGIGILYKVIYNYIVRAHLVGN